MRTPFLRRLLLAAWSCACVGSAVAGSELCLRIAADTPSIPVGKSVAVTAMATRDGQKVADLELWAYVNGRQWGAQEVTAADGKATFMLPLPNVGNAQVQVAPAPDGFRWPVKTFGQTADFLVGTPLIPQSPVSNSLQLTVTARKFAPLLDPVHLVGTTWYPWFTRYNAHINGGHSEAEGIPLLGSYASSNPDVIRQQMLWLDEIGVNFIQVDWSNNLGSSMHWKDHPPGVDEMVESTRALLDTLARMRSEGLATPQVLILLGMAPPFSVAALNEEMQFVYDAFVTKPEYAGLFVMYQGKPLTTVLSVLPGDEIRQRGTVDKSHFTVRWEWVGVADRPGWWSWTDPYLPPTTAYLDGVAEALSVTPAYSAGRGWKDPLSLGKNGGSTWVQGFQEAMRTRPAFLLLQQFNEWGEQSSAELSSDFEPSTLTTAGQGQTGLAGGAGLGWGYHYLNLARALVTIYHGQAPESTVLAVGAPLRYATVSSASVNLAWQTIGPAVPGFCITLDGAVKASGLHGNAYELSLAGIPAGQHTVTITAEGAVTRFPLSWDEDDEPTGQPIGCSVLVPFTLN